jgi:hypothetical protein
MQMPSGRRLLRFGVLLALAVLGSFAAKFIGTPNQLAFDRFFQTTSPKIAIAFYCVLAAMFVLIFWQASKHPWD